MLPASYWKGTALSLSSGIWRCCDHAKPTRSRNATLRMNANDAAMRTNCPCDLRRSVFRNSLTHGIVQPSRSGSGLEWIHSASLARETKLDNFYNLLKLFVLLTTSNTRVHEMQSVYVCP